MTCTVKDEFGNEIDLAELFASDPVTEAEPFDLTALTVDQLEAIEAGINCDALSASFLNSLFKAAFGCASCCGRYGSNRLCLDSDSPGTNGIIGTTPVKLLDDDQSVWLPNLQIKEGAAYGLKLSGALESGSAANVAFLITVYTVEDGGAVDSTAVTNTLTFDNQAAPDSSGEVTFDLGEILGVADSVDGWMNIKIERIAATSDNSSGLFGIIAAEVK